MSRLWDLLPDETREKIQELLTEAPVRLSAIANVLGVTVISAPLPQGISGEIRPDPNAADKYIIKVNKFDSGKRQRFTVAHELAHFLFHRHEIGAGVTDDVLYRSSLSDAREVQANKFAAELLMPMPLVGEWLDRAATLKVEDPVEFLANKFNVSEAAMRIRLGL